MSWQKAVFALEDGSVFEGRAFGAKKTVVGEVVFNTAMSGYQEAITDPAYFGQILSMTAVEVGNYGVNSADSESDGVKVAGLVVREVSPIPSNWRSEMSLQEYLEKQGVPAISGVDTRAITRKIRDAGTMKACLSTEGISGEEALEKARAWAGLEGVDCVKEVSCKAPYDVDFDETCVPFTVNGTVMGTFERTTPTFKCAAIDFGAKQSMFKKLAFAGFDVRVFPANATAEMIDEFKPDCVFLSSGAGDPSAVKYAHDCVAKLVKKYPTLGVGMGLQIIAHAIGAKTYKLKFGHRGGNHPVKNLEADKVSITAQNHSYAADAKSLEDAGAIVTELNLNDNSVEGFRLKDLPVFAVQYYPEAMPEPIDADTLFTKFYKMVKSAK